ncbi:MAG: serine/threonine protein kinase [Pseudanabaena sp. RU_4_16]|nr:serine/threonine protein kinase [Pseudanabaena sp. RU_4_16]
MVGKILRNRYKIARQIGSGGFGITYLAEDADLPGKPLCVVKHFRPKNSDRSALPIAKSLFDKEASTLYKLGQLHDQIPQLFAHFEENDEFYLVQEFIDGHTLSSELYRDKQLSELEVSHLLLNILDVLAVVHQHGVIHRDIKPPNLMRRHRDGKIVLIDFGAVKEISTLTIDEQGQTSVTVGIGSSGYMPDEQANGKPKLGSDVYAVGMIGIQALTGLPPSQLPEDADTGEIIWRDLVQVSDGLAEVLNTMVKPHFSQRYRSAETALQGLLHAVGDALPPRPTRVILSATPPFSGISESGDRSTIETAASDRITIIDTASSSNSSTFLEMAMPSDPILAGASLMRGETSTAIEHPISSLNSPMLVSVRARTRRLSPQVLVLGIAGIGIAIASIWRAEFP